MLRTLLAIFRPLHVIAKELSALRELYEMELRERQINIGKDWVSAPLTRITEKPKKGDVTVTYQGDPGPRYKNVDWLDGDQEDFPE